MLHLSVITSIFYLIDIIYNCFIMARLFDMKRKKEEARVAASRRSMIGSGDRSAKIRTFNFPQGRVTDHRINLTLYRLQEILTGDLDEVIEKLQMAERDEIMKEA